MERLKTFEVIQERSGFHWRAEEHVLTEEEASSSSLPIGFLVSNRIYP